MRENFVNRKIQACTLLFLILCSFLKRANKNWANFEKMYFFKKNQSNLKGILETFGWFSMSKNDLEIKIFSIFCDKAKNLRFIFDLWLKIAWILEFKFKSRTDFVILSKTSTQTHFALYYGLFLPFLELLWTFWLDLLNNMAK